MAYKGFLRSVLLRNGEVMVDEFGPVRLQLDGGPHPRVEVSKVVVHVDAFVAVAPQGPACQLRALRIRTRRVSAFVFSTLSSSQNLEGFWNLLKGHLVSVRIHGRQQVDASFFDQVDNPLVSSRVLLAQILHEVEQQLPAQSLVPVHPCDVSKLWFSCRTRQSTDSLQTTHDFHSLRLFFCYFRIILGFTLDAAEKISALRFVFLKRCPADQFSV